MSLQIAIFFKKRRSNQDITPACFSLELGKVNFCGCIQYSLFQKSNDRFFFVFFMKNCVIFLRKYDLMKIEFQ